MAHYCTLYYIQSFELFPVSIFKMVVCYIEKKKRGLSHDLSRLRLIQLHFLSQVCVKIAEIVKNHSSYQSIDAGRSSRVQCIVGCSVSLTVRWL